ncbi:MAG: hypothetical protein BGN83_19275 [Rhizobium sp. 63-7]|nr:MAG: hypothetical protein BGN83_19275 [Rhizobium sp. 63-7]
MRRYHFESLRPVCPLCRRQGNQSALAILVVEAEEDDDIRSGILSCGACGAEFPILDGLPVLVPEVRRYVQDNLFYILARNDLTPAVEGLIGDAAGPGSGLEAIRQHVSSYAWDHWGDRDPEGAGDLPGGATPGAVIRNLASGLEMIAADMADGPILDIGCGTGRTTAELAERTGRLTLGIDISMSLARAGRQAVVGGVVDYALRRNGLVYDRRRYAAGHKAGKLADIWICDVMALPFETDTFAAAAAMNVVDCMVDPRAGLTEISRALRPDGAAILSVPFDWSGQVTPVEAWLGGHSQRAAHRGSPEAILDMLLSDGPLAAGDLRRNGPSQEVPWHVRLHDRSCMYYSAHLVAARKTVK